MTTETQIRGYPPDHPAFDGHFPGNPIVPGVLLLDAALHAAGAHAPVRIDSAKFLGVVRADEPLELQITQRGEGLSFTLHHGERAVAAGTFAPT